MNWSPFQKFIFTRTYSRFLEDAKRRETYEEAVERVVNFFADHISQIRPSHKALAKKAILNMEVMPSMRMMWAAGRAVEQNNIAAYNCSYVVVKDVRVFSEILYILMSGTGVGFSVESRFVDTLPIVKPRDEKVVKVKVEDSKEGWAKALDQVLGSLWNGHAVDVDYSAVRPRGARLRTMGGRASGPAPLKNLIDYASNLFACKGGKKLTSLEAHDLCCMIADIVVVGGVRRSSLISLSDLDDGAIAECKTGEFWKHTPYRKQANNSAVYETKPDGPEFLKEWVTLMKSGAGERGIFNREAAMVQMVASGRRSADSDVGTNPCVTGDTVIATVDGPKSFAELAAANQDVFVYAWSPITKLPVVRMMRNPRLTSCQAAILEVELDSGLKVRVTPDHSFYTFRGNKVEAKNLVAGQSLRAFSMSKHKHGHLRVHGWNSNDNCAAHQWVARMVWEEAYGSVPEGLVVHHKDDNKENNKLENLELVTPAEHNSIHYLQRLMNGFHHPSSTKEKYLETYNHKVVSIRPAGYADVYNGTVDDVHTYVILDPSPVAGIASGVISANCGEILLKPYEFCNLSSVVIRADDTLITLKEKVKTAAMLGCWQSTFIKFPYIRADWQKNCSTERLLGVSLTGIMDHPVLNHVNDEAKHWLSEMKHAAIGEARRWSKKLGINMPAAVTCVKPEGTSSSMNNSSSGIHPRYAKNYIRRVRISATDPLFRMMKAQGVPCNPEVGQEPTTADTWVIDFPVAAPVATKTRHSITAIEQLEHWLMVKSFWCEHNPSCTVYVGEHEWVSVAAWVYDHFNDVCGISFLPKEDSKHVYQLAPFEEITKEQCDELLPKFPAIDYSQLVTYELEDTTEGSKTYACTGDKCEIV